MKILVAYFSNTGNTESIANDIEFALKKNHDVDIDRVDSLDPSVVANYDGIILGCPACGTEELDDGVFQPFYDEIKPNIKDKKVALFGSQDWGTGEFMETWEADAKNAGLNVVATLVVNDADLGDFDVSPLVDKFN